MKKTLVQKIVLWAVCVLFFLYSLTLVYAFIWAFLSSLKTNSEFFNYPFSLPKEWLFDNYIKAFSELKIDNSNLVNMFGNSIYLATAGTLLSVLSSTVTGYIISKYNFPGRNFIYALAIFIQVIPIVGGLPARYKFMNDVGMRNNPILILLNDLGGFDFAFLVMFGFFNAVSWSYAEAAYIDGASEWTVFTQVMIPQAVPAMVSMFILAFIGRWNDYMTPFLYMDKYPTLALGLYKFQVMQTYRSNIPIFFAGVILSVIPIFILFIAFQKTLMENTVAGGLKG